MQRNEGKLKQRYVWRHNSYKGSARMMEMQLIEMIYSPSTTSETKELAANIHANVLKLKELLEQRIDPPSRNSARLSTVE